MMEHTDENKQVFAIYETLVMDTDYKEPVDGEFEDATASILEGIGSDQTPKNSKHTQKIN